MQIATPTALEREARTAAGLREALQLDPTDVVALLLPPIQAQSGAFYAVWATLLCYQVRPDVRLVVPGVAGRGPDLRHLARATRHQRAIRFAPRERSLGELLTLARAAAFLPTGDQPIDALLEAISANVPVIVSRTPAMAGLLQDGEEAWLVRPGEARDAARALLEALENPTEAARRAASARRRIRSFQGTNATSG